LRYFYKILLSFLLLTSSISAQENISSGRDSIVTGEILVESNRLKMTKLLSPNKIQVFDAGDIRNLNGSRLPDALEMSDAVFIKDYGFNSGTKTISLNATQSEHTLILLNGVRLNSRQNAQFDLSLLDLDNVSRIEISNGGSSALYGSEAIGGVINIITNSPGKTQGLGLNFKSVLGSYGYRKFYGSVSQDMKAGLDNLFSYRVSFSDERAKNNFEYNFKNGLNVELRERENSDFNTQYFDLDLGYRYGSGNLLRLFANYTHFNRGVPGIDAGYSTGTARQIDYNLMTGVTSEKQISKVLTSKSAITYKNALQKYFDPSTFNLSVRIDSYYRLNSILASQTFNYMPSVMFNIESGIDFSFDEIFSNETEKGELFNGSVFAAAKYEVNTGIISKISFYPSIRYDYFSNIEDKSVVTGKFGINLKAFENSELSFKSTIGNNFSAPTFNELYWNGLGNKDLKPERSISFDAGMFYRFRLLAVNELEVSYYNINTTDRIVWTPVGGVWRPLNIGKVRSEGIDAVLNSKFEFSNSWVSSLGLNYSYGSAIKKNEDFAGDPSYNKQLIYLPQEMIKASFMIHYLTTSKLLKSVSFNLFYKFYTRRYTNFENTAFIPRFDVVDANFGAGIRVWELNAGLKFIVNNVLNESYNVLPGYPMPLRNFKFEISLKY
jgi:vitamin B12 transporter